MSVAPVKFQSRQSIEQVEEGNDLAPKFDDRGLITVVSTDADSGELLMQGYMNAEALGLTIKTGEAHYYSRSRRVLWHKGATSGFVQNVRILGFHTQRRRQCGAQASCLCDAVYMETPIRLSRPSSRLEARSPPSSICTCRTLE